MQYNYCIAGNSKLRIVLQESVLQYTGLYCREEGSVVLQDCIARDLARDNLYRNTVYCIVAGRAAEDKVISQYNLEYCGKRQGCLCRDTALGAAGARTGALGSRLGAQGVQGAHGAGGSRRAGRARRIGRRARGASMASERQQARQARGAHGGNGAGARGTAGWVAWARGLGVLLANRVCTQPVFNPI